MGYPCAAAGCYIPLPLKNLEGNGHKNYGKEATPSCCNKMYIPSITRPTTITVLVSAAIAAVGAASFYLGVRSVHAKIARVQREAIRAADEEEKSRAQAQSQALVS